MSASIPEGLTDPDEIDRWLDAHDADVAYASTQRDADDATVMASLPKRRHLHAVADDVDVNSKAAIAARIAYSQLPLRERMRRTIRGERPVGYVDRYPVRPWSRSIPQDM